jgi:hypothetical protein
MIDNGLGAHPKDFGTMLCNGGRILAEELVYLVQVGVDGNVVVLVCRERLGWRKPQEDGRSMVHDE